MKSKLEWIIIIIRYNLFFVLIKLYIGLNFEKLVVPPKKKKYNNILLIVKNSKSQKLPKISFII